MKDESTKKWLCRTESGQGPHEELLTTTELNEWICNASRLPGFKMLSYRSFQAGEAGDEMYGEWDHV